MGLGAPSASAACFLSDASRKTGSAACRPGSLRSPPSAHRKPALFVEGRRRFAVAHNFHNLCVFMTVARNRSNIMTGMAKIRAISFRRLAGWRLLCLLQY